VPSTYHYDLIILNPQSEIPNPQLKNPQSEIPNPQLKNPQSEIPNPQYSVLSAQ